MCKVSDKIKFCSCSSKELDKQKHVWIFYRYVGDKYISVMGSMVEPYTPDAATDIYNRELLLQRINEPDAFDIDLKPKAKDYLQLTFTCGKDREQLLTYGYIYKKKQWCESDLTDFDLEEKHEENKAGKIKDALLAS